MKKYILLLTTLFCINLLHAQVSYYKGEWTRINKHDCFTGIFKISIDKDNMVKGELLWTYIAIDSTDKSMTEQYHGKKKRTGIEYVEGSYNTSTHDIYFEGRSKEDPWEIIGLDKYTLKLSLNMQILYGSTDSQGSKDALFYGTRISSATGQKEFGIAKALLQKRSSRK